jgi:aspartate ammonia-lyase
MSTRIEWDALGEKEIPQEAYYGIQTARAVENFPISGQGPHPRLVWATALVKRAAAEANMAVGQLDPRIGRAIVQAAQEVIEGRWRDQFVVDVFQAGAGTSHNMNANEVLANRAIEVLGGSKGDYRLVHPNDHVNMAQSTNDTFPTAMRLASLSLLEELYKALGGLEAALTSKAVEFQGVVKSGRTHLQDAVPITLGKEFGAYAVSLRRGLRRLRGTARDLRVLSIGGTAVGTGLNTHPRYRHEVIKRLRELTGFDLRASTNPVEATQSMADFAHVSGALRLLALELIRIANDLRLMSSGPKAGLGEINLPPVQPGSSIMPGKVNPVMAEVTNMVCFQVVGNDLAISLACQAGQLELNVMMPVIAFNLLQSLDLLKNVTLVFTQRCVEGITANQERCRRLVEESLGLATALNPYIGYERAASIAKEAQATGRTIRQIVVEKGVLSSEELEKVLDPDGMVTPAVRRSPRSSPRRPP